jgi:hypothetical protein
MAHWKSSSVTARNPSRRRRPDVVDEHVDAAVVVHRLLDQASGGFRVGEIAGDAGHAVESVKRLGVPRRGHHLGALVGEGLGDRQADAGTGARDDRNLACELEVH